MAQDLPPEVGADPALPDAADEQALPEDYYDEDTIVVSGARLQYRVDTPAPPVLELDAQDIAAYGVGSIAELLEELSSEVGSSRGRGGGSPVTLINGARISSMREMRSYPPESVDRIEVFTEEVALQYGYSADQRVVNIILKDNFTSREIEVEYGQPWDGGYSEQEVEATYLHIDGPSRLNFNFDWERSSMLTEAERGIIQSDNSIPTFASDPDPAAYRSLVSETGDYELTGNWTARLNESGTSLSVNGTFERNDSLSLQGLDSILLADSDAADANTALRVFNLQSPLTVDTRSDTYALGSTLNTGLGNWSVTATLDASREESHSLIARNADTTGLVEDAAAGLLALDADLSGLVPAAGFDEANSTTDSVAALITARNEILALPAGDLGLVVDGGYDWERIQSEDTRNTGAPARLLRGNVSAGANLIVPLTSRGLFLGAVGDITANFSAGVDHLSDFGTLYDWSAGLNWGLTDRLSLNANYINRDTAPTLAQLGDPEVATVNVQTYDIARDETVLATIISGGNPDLTAQKQSDWKFGLVWELPKLERGTLTIDYVRNRSENVASAFPVLTPAIEAAFADRVTRDPISGQLLQIDQRPVTFARQDIERLQFALNLGGSIGKESRGERGGRGEGGGAPSAGGPPAGGGGRPGGGGGRRGFGRGGGDGSDGRWFVNLQYTLDMKNDVLIADGVPVLDILDGDAVSSGGQPRHSANLRAGVFYKGFGLFSFSEYTGASRIDGSGLTDSTDLLFEDYFTVSGRFFVNLGEQESLVKSMPWLDDTRLSFGMRNIFDTRQRVTDSEGEVPIRYQPYLIDPTGRRFEVEIRKLF